MFLKKVIISTLFLFINLAYLNAKPQNDGRIVGGVFQPIELRPYQATVYPNSNLCGGAIVSEYWVVTAAHCVYGLDAYEVNIAVGVQDTSVVGKKIYRLEDVINHPNYDHATKNNDIAMLKTQKEIIFNDLVMAIELAFTLPPDGAMVTVSGYGNDGFQGKTTNVLMSANLFMVNFDTCNEAFEGNITKNMFCATVPNFDKDSCQGDSGGPITYRDKLVGVVSFGRKCAEKGYPGVYTSVPNFIPWLYNLMGKALPDDVVIESKEDSIESEERSLNVVDDSNQIDSDNNGYDANGYDANGIYNYCYDTHYNGCDSQGNYNYPYVKANVDTDASKYNDWGYDENGVYNYCYDTHYNGCDSQGNFNYPYVNENFGKTR